MSGPPLGMGQLKTYSKQNEHKCDADRKGGGSGERLDLAPAESIVIDWIDLRVHPFPGGRDSGSRRGADLVADDFQYSSFRAEFRPLVWIFHAGAERGAGTDFVWAL